MERITALNVEDVNIDIKQKAIREAEESSTKIHIFEDQNAYNEHLLTKTKIEHRATYCNFEIDTTFVARFYPGFDRIYDRYPYFVADPNHWANRKTFSLRGQKYSLPGYSITPEYVEKFGSLDWYPTKFMTLDGIRHQHTLLDQPQARFDKIAQINRTGFHPATDELLRNYKAELRVVMRPFHLDWPREMDSMLENPETGFPLDGFQTFLDQQYTHVKYIWNWLFYSVFTDPTAIQVFETSQAYQQAKLIGIDNTAFSHMTKQFADDHNFIRLFRKPIQSVPRYTTFDYDRPLDTWMQFRDLIDHSEFPEGDKPLHWKVFIIQQINGVFSVEEAYLQAETEQEAINNAIASLEITEYFKAYAIPDNIIGEMTFDNFNHQELKVDTSIEFSKEVATPRIINQWDSVIGNKEKLFDGRFRFNNHGYPSDGFDKIKSIGVGLAPHEVPKFGELTGYPWAKQLDFDPLLDEQFSPELLTYIDMFIAGSPNNLCDADTTKEIDLSILVTPVPQTTRIQLDSEKPVLPEPTRNADGYIVAPHFPTTGIFAEQGLDSGRTLDAVYFSFNAYDSQSIKPKGYSIVKHENVPELSNADWMKRQDNPEIGSKLPNCIHNGERPTFKEGYGYITTIPNQFDTYNRGHLYYDDFADVDHIDETHGNIMDRAKMDIYPLDLGKRFDAEELPPEPRITVPLSREQDLFMLMPTFIDIETVQNCGTIGSELVCGTIGSALICGTIEAALLCGTIGAITLAPAPIAQFIAIPLTYDEQYSNNGTEEYFDTTNLNPFVTPEGFYGNGYDTKYTIPLPAWAQTSGDKHFLATIDVHEGPRDSSRDTIFTVEDSSTGNVEFGLVVKDDTAGSSIPSEIALNITGNIHPLFRKSWRYEIQYPELTIGANDARPQGIEFIGNKALVTAHYEDNESWAHFIDFSDGSYESFRFDNEDIHASTISTKEDDGSIWISSANVRKYIYKVDVDASLASGTISKLISYNCQALYSTSAIAWINVSGTNYLLIGEYSNAQTPYVYVIPESEITDGGTFSIGDEFKRFVIQDRCQGLVFNNGLLYSANNRLSSDNTPVGKIMTHDIVDAINNLATNSTLPIIDVWYAPGEYVEDIDFYDGRIWTLTEGLLSVGHTDGWRSIWSRNLANEYETNHVNIAKVGSTITVNINNRLFDTFSTNGTVNSDYLSIGAPYNLAPSQNSGYFIGNIRNVYLQESAIDSDTYNNVINGNHESYSITEYPITVLNGNAESNTDHWTNESGAIARGSSNPTPYEGSGYFWGGTSTTSIASQQIDMLSETGLTQSQANLSGLWARVDWHQASFNGSDEANMGLRFLDASLNVLEETYSDSISTLPGKTWVSMTYTRRIPTHTAHIVLLQRHFKTAGTNNDGYIDAIKLRVYKQ